MILKTMTDFILEQKKKINAENEPNLWDYLRVNFKYAEFLKQPLALGMFVPCDGKGEALIDPENLDCDGITYYSKLNEYECAKHNILFKGFELIFDDKVRSTISPFCFHIEQFDNVEQLANIYSNEIVFTEQAIYNLFRQ